MQSKTTLLTYSALMCSLIIVSALWLKFSIPGTEILVTLQVFFIQLCGQILPPKYCLYTIGAYIFIGLTGIPVFSAAAGPAVIAMPTFGYIVSFPFSIYTISKLRGVLKTKLAGYFAGVAGVVVEYIVALAYIAMLQGVFLGKPLPFSVLMSAYCIAFLPLDILKAIFAAFIGGRLRRILKLT